MNKLNESYFACRAQKCPCVIFLSGKYTKFDSTSKMRKIKNRVADLRNLDLSKRKTEKKALSSKIFVEKTLRFYFFPGVGGIYLRITLTYLHYLEKFSKRIKEHKRLPVLKYDKSLLRKDFNDHK